MAALPSLGRMAERTTTTARAAAAALAIVLLPRC